MSSLLTASTCSEYCCGNRSTSGSVGRGGRRGKRGAGSSAEQNTLLAGGGTLAESALRHGPYTTTITTTTTTTTTYTTTSTTIYVYMYMLPGSLYNNNNNNNNNINVNINNKDNKVGENKKLKVVVVAC